MEYLTPRKSDQSEGRTDEEFTPVRLLSKVESWKASFPFLSEFEQKFHGLIIAKHVPSLLDYEEFLSRNDLIPFSKKISLIKGELYIDEEFDAPESLLHVQGVSFFSQLFFRWLDKINPRPAALRVALNSRQANSLLVSCHVPDVSMDINFRGIFIVEIVYSSGLANAHEKMDDYFQQGSCRAGVIIYIRYPWESNGVNYLVNDGLVCFIYYEKPNEGEALAARRVVFFGDSIPSEDDIERICGITAFPGLVEGNIEGGGGLPCSEENRDNEMFRHLIPNNIILLSDDPNPVVMGVLPENFQFIINLFELKVEFQAGIVEMNRRVATLQETLVTRQPRIY